MTTRKPNAADKLRDKLRGHSPQTPASTGLRKLTGADVKALAGSTYVLSRESMTNADGNGTPNMGLTFRDKAGDVVLAGRYRSRELAARFGDADVTAWAAVLATVTG